MIFCQFIFFMRVRRVTDEFIDKLAQELLDFVMKLLDQLLFRIADRCFHH